MKRILVLLCVLSVSFFGRAQNITAAEFFVDTDPGVGNGTAIIVTAGSTVTFTASIPTTSLGPGFHFLAIRTRGADGKWGLFESRGFYISTQTANATDMVAAEYFLDADPGVGGGMPITITQSSNINQNFILNIPGGTSQGQHFLALRFKGTDGKWGLFDFDTITVAGAVPLRFLGFDVRKNGNMVLVEWKTDNEFNTSHFVVERSINGIDFITLGSVTATNRSGINSYTFTDPQPFKGVNLYRLKQVDRDARFEYSEIKKLFFGSKENIIVYPNPVTELFSIRLISASPKWMAVIYDADGKSVIQEMINNTSNNLQMDVKLLPRGIFWIVLNSGIETFTGKFMKD